MTQDERDLYWAAQMIGDIAVNQVGLDSYDDQDKRVVAIPACALRVMARYSTLPTLSTAKAKDSKE